jgi:hypothetical protein
MTVRGDTVFVSDLFSRRVVAIERTGNHVHTEMIHTTPLEPSQAPAAAVAVSPGPLYWAESPINAILVANGIVTSFPLLHVTRDGGTCAPSPIGDTPGEGQNLRAVHRHVRRGPPGGGAPAPPATVHVPDHLSPITEVMASTDGRTYIQENATGAAAARWVMLDPRGEPPPASAPAPTSRSSPWRGTGSGA